MAEWLKKEVKKGDESEDEEFEVGEEDLQKAGADEIVEADLIKQEQKEIREELKQLNQLNEEELELKKLEMYNKEKKNSKRDKDGYVDDQDEQEDY